MSVTSGVTPRPEILLPDYAFFLPASVAVKNSADGMSTVNGQAASSELPSLADMFKPKPGEWD